MGAPAAAAVGSGVAVVLHGRIGLWKTRSSHIDDAKVVWLSNVPQQWKSAPTTMAGIDLTPHSALVGFAAFGSGSIRRHVIEPNRAAGLHVDIFLHSWHPEIGRQLDAMYAPASSRHEPIRRRLDSVRSQHLSMKRGLELAAEGARSRGREYELVLVSRYDVLFFSDLMLDRLLGSPLVLPHWCHRYSLTAEQGSIVRAACGNWAGHGEGYLIHPAHARGVVPTKAMRASLSREADYDYAYLDWWFVATPAVAATFGAIYDEYDDYTAKLARIAAFPKWTHFYWGYHINDVLRMRTKVRYTLYEGIDFRLARHWAYGTHCSHWLGGPDGAAARALETAGVNFDAFLRRRADRSADAAVYGRASADDGNRSDEYTRHCPYDPRVRIYCPWYSPACPAQTRRRVLAVEAAAHLALNSSSRMPPWTLFGGAELISDARRGVAAREKSRAALLRAPRSRPARGRGRGRHPADSTAPAGGRTASN